MKYLFPLLISLPLLGACSRADLDLSTPLLQATAPLTQGLSVVGLGESASTTKPESEGDFGDILLAEMESPAPARQILREGRRLALEEKAIIRGSCWNWINTVYKRAGYDKDRHIVFKSKKRGPFARSEQIQPGDWLYYINHSYNGIEHSGIFVHWIDYDKKIGMILSYGGEGRRQPGRYQPYDLSNVYFIKRPGDREDMRLAQAR